jgi:hypothetical protein
MFEILFILSFVSLVRSIPIDNGVVGDPEIECGTTNIEINFNVQVMILLFFKNYKFFRKVHNQPKILKFLN